MNQAGNPISGGMPTQFNTGGAQPQPGFGGMDRDGNPINGGPPDNFHTSGAQPGFGGITNTVGRFAAPALNQIVPGAGNNLGPQLGRAIGISQPGGQPPNPGFGRFQPGGMIPPAGSRTGAYTVQRAPVGDPRRYGNPRQVNPGQGPMQPGMPAQPPGYGGGKGGFQGPMEQLYGEGGRYSNPATGGYLDGRDGH
jgi:hypothetical protein